MFTYDGIEESSRFSMFHPLTTVIYYSFVLGLTMCSESPIILLLSLFFAVIYKTELKGMKTFPETLKLLGSVIFFITLLNGLFSHNGITVLFKIGSNSITAEAFICGLSMSIMLLAVILWFSSFNSIMTSEKLIFVFGKINSTFGLLMSMVFRFIPLLKIRLSEITTGRKCMGRNEPNGLLERIKRFNREVSTLITWSLESSIETADSMAGRGYGLKGRTSYNLYRFEFKDIVFAVSTVLLAAFNIYLFVKGTGRVEYYPEFISSGNDIRFRIYVFLNICLYVLPIIIDTIGELKWKKSELRI